jgi:hypothetical protein
LVFGAVQLRISNASNYFVKFVKLTPWLSLLGVPGYWFKHEFGCNSVWKCPPECYSTESGKPFFYGNNGHSAAALGPGSVPLSIHPGVQGLGTSSFPTAAVSCSSP